MDKKILKFIKSNNILTMATCSEGQPYCANCFYAFDEKRNVLVFLSDDTTRHIEEALENNKVAGTINTKFTSIAKIQGIQFVGVFISPNETEERELYSIYYKKYPFAEAKPASVWGIKLEYVKMTDNTLGFGKKIIWNQH